MNLFKKISSRFTVRGKMLGLVEQGMALADKKDSDEAIKIYSQVIDSPDSPRDVMAMAKFNRALVYAAIDRLNEAKQDLQAIVAMPETMSKIKKSASDKIARMERKVVRENLPSRNELGSRDRDSGGGH